MFIQEAMSEEIQSMKAELQRLKNGIKAYEDEYNKTGGKVDLSKHDFRPSILRKLPYIQTIIKLQQGLQQAYCLNAVQSSNAVLTEPNSMQFASCATFLQTHQVGEKMLCTMIYRRCTMTYSSSHT